MQPIVNTKERPWNRIVFGVLLLCVCIALLRWFFMPGKDSAFHPVTIADLNGVWTTPDPDYENRFLQFDNNTITFGWGPDGIGTYTIDQIDGQAGMDGTRVRIQYHDLAGTDFQFSFWYVDENGVRLKMKKQKGNDWFHTNDQPIHSPVYQ